MTSLALPALRAQMGDWTYYVALMKMRDISERVSLADEIHKSQAMKDLIQREVDESSHSLAISRFLLNHDQRLFNSLVVGVYGGTPIFYDLVIADNPELDEEDIPYNVENSLGVLILDGNEKLFALDGQHRVAGIRKAVQEERELGEEEVSIIFVSHSNDPLGLERTRRLFTRLNRYAKPVSRYEKIALDEDDVIAIVTRDLVEEHPLFRDKVSLSKGKNISTQDHISFTSVVALYEALDHFLRMSLRGWKDYKGTRPSDQVIEQFKESAVNLWNVLVKYFPPIYEMMEEDPEAQVAKKYRNRTGGHLLFRPVGLLMFIKVVRKLIDLGLTLEKAIERLANIPMELSEAPWLGLLWDHQNKRMITAGENQRAGIKLMYYSVGGDLADFRSSTQLLKEELAGVLNRNTDEVELPRYL